MPKNYEKIKDGYMIWLQRINTLYFFRNQSEVFDCFLTTMNKKVYVSYNQDSRLSIDFAEFISATLPTNIKDKRRRFYNVKKP